MSALIDTTQPTLMSTDWRSLHLWTERPRAEVDQLMTEVLAPIAKDLQSSGMISRWFFIRYSQGGQHLRLRVAAASDSTLAHLAGRLGSLEGLRVTESKYEPETERYGGAELLGVNEELFCLSTQIAVAALRHVPTEAHRTSAAIDFMLATARALDLDKVTAIAWLRSNAYSWRWHRDEVGFNNSAALHNAALLASTSGHRTIAKRWHDDGRHPLSVTWQRAVRSAADAMAILPQARVLGIFSSQLHMLLNRIGITPTEERWTAWFIAAGLECAEGAVDFFDPDASACDRAYLSASRYVEPRMAEQQPRQATSTQLFDWTPGQSVGIALPPAEPGAVSLVDALRARRSGRGPYQALQAADLSSLLWNATIPVDCAGIAGRSYPSAGGQYSARLRLAVRDVAGLKPGLYEANLSTRRLIPISQPPPDSDLRATSMWFDGTAPAWGRIEVAELPVLLALYMDLGGIRGRYGLRALRFALLEAGHLAQNLALIAASLELQLCTLGGFYDDIAHDVFMLDGIERSLAYLIPIGATR